MTIVRRLFYPAAMLDTLLRSLIPLLEPIGFVWLCLWIAAVWLWIKKRRGVAMFLLVLVAFMWVVGCSRIPGDLVATLEEPFIVRDLDKLPTCDAVVVLGGAVRPSKFDVAGLDFKPAADRVIMGLELIRRGKAGNLVVSGAVQNVNGRKLVEADLIRHWLATWHLPNAPVESLSDCCNTHDEALRVAALRREKGWQNILLVTSAYHMKRAQAVFRTAGVPVVCVPCDFQTEISIETEWRWAWVPRHGGFEKLSLYIHEQIGWVMYRWRGWIRV